MHLKLPITTDSVIHDALLTDIVKINIDNANNKIDHIQSNTLKYNVSLFIATYYSKARTVWPLSTNYRQNR